SSWCTTAPVFKTNILNGRPVARFSAVNGSCLVTPAFSASTPVTVMTVSKFGGGSNNTAWGWMSGGTGSNGGFANGCVDNSGLSVFSCGTDISYSAAQTTWLIKEFVFKAGGVADQVQILGNDPQTGNSSSYAFPSAQFMLGGHPNFNNFSEFA